MLPTLRDLLELPALHQGDPLVRAGAQALDQPVRWVHVSEISDIANLLEGGELILTTGIALPSSDRALRTYVRDLAAVGVTGLIVELGRRYRSALPDALVTAADRAGLPLVELRKETPFVAVTQAVHTLILDARMREIVASDERQQHRTLLTVLALATDLPTDVNARAEALGVPLTGRALTGIAVRTVDGSATPALLRDLSNRAADTVRALRVPALVGLLDDQHVAVLLSQNRPDRSDRIVQRLDEQLHALADQRPGVALVIGAGTTMTGADRAQTTLREALRVAEIAASLTPQLGHFRSSDLRLHGLVHELRDSVPVREYVEREIGALLAHDAERGTRLYDFLAAYCRAGGNKTEAAAGLFISRAALYDRMRKVEQVLDVDLADPGVILALHFAVLARDTLNRPDLAVRASPARATQSRP